MAVFSELSFAVCWQGRLVLQITALILTAIVNYSSDGGQSCGKGRKVWVIKYCLCTIGTAKAGRNAE